MKVLMLVNWNVKKSVEVPDDLQSPDFWIKNQKYWFFRHIDDENLSVNVVGVGKSFIAKLEKKLFNFYIWQTIKCIFSLNKYDVVISHGAQSGIFLALLRRLFGKGKYKHILIDVGAFNSASKKNGIKEKIIKYASKSLDYVISHQSNQLDYYKNHFPWLVNKSEFLRYGEDIDFFDKKYVDLPKEKIIVCVGYSKRDWETLIEAYNLINCEYKLVLIGHSVDTNNPNIVSYPFLEINQLLKILLKATFGILPLEDLNYSFGQMTYLQQGIMRVPMIVARSRSLIDYGIDEETCLFYEPKNKDDLKEKIEKMISNTELREKLSIKNYHFICDNINSKIMATNIYEIIKKVTKYKE